MANRLLSIALSRMQLYNITLRHKKIKFCPVTKVNFKITLKHIFTFNSNSVKLNKFCNVNANYYKKIKFYLVAKKAGKCFCKLCNSTYYRLGTVGNIGICVEQNLR